MPPAGVLFKQLSAGNHHTCGIDTEDGLHCWGIDDGSSFDFGQVSDAPSGIFSSVAAGYNHTCALNAGKAVCWGITPDNLNAPEQAGYEKGQVTAIPENIHFARLVAGHSHTCGIRTDGGLECWGSTNGQKDVPAAMNFQQLAAGFHNNCAIDSNQQLQCWGWTAWGLVEAVPTGAFQSVGCGYGHCCAVRTTGEIACWGVPNNPVMGSGVQDKGQVTDAPTSGEYRFVGGGTSHSCAVTSQDKAVCWGGGAAVITQVPLELQ